MELNEALVLLAETTGLELVYSSRSVADKQVYCTGRSLKPEALLRCILTGSGLDYVRSSSGAYILFESVAQPPQFGDVVGTVVDGATGEPLAFANVLLAEAEIGTTTNDAGLFTIASLISGAHRVVVTHVGYRPVADSIWVHPGTTQRLHVALQPEEITLKPVIVDGLTQRLPSMRLGSGTLTPEEIEAGGALGTADVIRGAAWIPGLTVQQPLADLHIQGGGAGEHITLLDDAPVRDPVSLGRYLSAFSPLAVGRITVHKAGFGADRGSHLSGVIEVEHDVASSDEGQLVASIDPVSLNGRISGRLRFPGEPSATFMVGGRMSLWGLYQDPGISDLLHSWNAVDPVLATLWTMEPVTSATLGPVRNESDVAFSDLHGAVRLHLTPFRSLYASAYRAHNDLSSELSAVHRDHQLETDRLIQAHDAYTWTNWVAQARYAHLVSSRSVLMVQALGSWNESLFSYAAAEETLAPPPTEAELHALSYRWEGEADTIPTSREKNHIRELALRAELSHSLSPGQQVEAELGVTHVRSDLLLENLLIGPFVHDADVWNLTGSVTGRLALGLKVAAEPGLRLTYLPERRSLYAEPRLSVRYDEAESRIGAYALRLAGGMYRQFIGQYALTKPGSTSLVPSTFVWMPIDRSLAPPTAYHLSGDVLLMPHQAWTIRFEAYHKWQQRLLTLDYVALLEQDLPGRGRGMGIPPPLAQSEFVVAAQGRAYGGGIRAQYGGHRTTLAASYDYSRAQHRVPGRFRGEAMPVPWNEPHVLQMNAELHITSSLDLRANWQSIWGRAWGLRRAYYDYIALRPYVGPFAGFDLHDPSSAVLPPLHQLDLGGSYRLSLGRAEVRTRLTVANVLNRRNVYDWSLDRVGTPASRLARTLPGRRLFLSVQLSY